MTQPIQPDDLFHLRFLQEAELSPDGAQVIYTVAHTAWEEDDGKSEWREYKTLWLLSLVDGSHRPLTAGTQKDSAPAWSPDGRTVAFLSDRKGKAQIFLLPVHGGEARALTQLPPGVGGKPVWSPDGTQIAFTAGPQEEPPDPNAPYRITSHVYRFDGLGSMERARQDIYSVDVASGETKRWTDDGFHNTQPLWSPEGRSLLCFSNFGADSYGRYPSVRVLDRAGTVRTILDEWGEMRGAGWLPDGEGIIFIGVPSGAAMGAQNDLWTLNLQGGEPINHTSNLDRQVGKDLQQDMPVEALRQPRILLYEGGKVALVQVQCGGEVRIYRVPLEGDGAPEVLLSGERSCYPLAVHTKKLLFAATTPFSPPDLFSLDLETGEEQRLTALNDELLEQRAQPTLEYLRFPGEDGVEVEGWLLLPATGSAPYPGFLYIHGGPHSAFGYGFSFDFQMLAGQGYAVLFINQRASTGYGNDFATAIKGDWGHLDYTDLMAGVDHAIERGFLDPERLAVGGLSGGGNLTCWIVGQTDRFKAAIPENPVTNWVSFYGVSDIGPWFAVDELGGHPHEIPEVYRRCSPITYAHRCTTPTLLVQGEHDWRCPAEQSEQFYAVLKANGCPVEMLRLPASFHSGSITGRPAVRQAHNEALLAWLTQWVPAHSPGTT
jgi:dipeptidyl aminopeptidase/acylaminoacyl peptidase